MSPAHFLPENAFALNTGTYSNISAVTPNQQVRVRSRNAESSLLCQLELNVIELGADDGETDEEYLSCVILNKDGTPRAGTFYLESLPRHIEERVDEPLRTGEDIVLTIPGASLTTDTVVVRDPSAISVLEGPSRLLRQVRQLRTPPSIGDVKTAVIRVKANGTEPDFSAVELQFLIYHANPSVKLQFARCSNNALTFLEPTFGVVDVQLGVPASGNSPMTLVNLAEVEANRILGQTDGISNIRGWANMLLFVLPPGTGGWVAYATVSGKQSTYNNRWGGYLGAVMHELGHNLGLRHSFENGQEYQGRSGYMGLQPPRTMEPQMCYNGHDHFKLNWFHPHVLELSVGVASETIAIAAFVDFDRIRPNEFVILKVGDLYLQYNRATRHNRQTLEMANRLTVVRGRSRGTDLLGGLLLDDHATFSISDGPMLSVAVCEVNSGNGVNADTMLVSVGTGQIQCPQPTPPSPWPTRAPSQPPSSRPTPNSDPPTFNPTESPSRSPTDEPSPAPSRSPTFSPSIKPTPQPSKHPTPQPSKHPTHFPTMLPSLPPSHSPTLAPSNPPSPSPSTNPTLLPTPDPTSSPSNSPTDNPSPYPSSSPTSSPSKDPTPLPSEHPTRLPSNHPTLLPTLLPSASPSQSPTLQPSRQPTHPPTPLPSEHPTPLPSKHPTPLPTLLPSAAPSLSVTLPPSEQPTHSPTPLHSNYPTVKPTTISMSVPTTNPSAPPSQMPSKHPTPESPRHPTPSPQSSQSSPQPTEEDWTQFQTSQPTRNPTSMLSTFPSSQPTVHPTPSPTTMPTYHPTLYPTPLPFTVLPTLQPTSQPTKKPTHLPSEFPTTQPSRQPSLSPSKIATIGPSLTNEMLTRNPTQSQAPSNTGIPSWGPTLVVFEAPYSVSVLNQEARENSGEEGPNLSVLLPVVLLTVCFVSLFIAVCLVWYLRKPRISREKARFMIDGRRKRQYQYLERPDVGSIASTAEESPSRSMSSEMSFHDYTLRQNRLGHGQQRRPTALTHRDVRVHLATQLDLLADHQDFQGDVEDEASKGESHASDIEDQCSLEPQNLFVVSSTPPSRALITASGGWSSIQTQETTHLCSESGKKEEKESGGPSLVQMLEATHSLSDPSKQEEPKSKAVQQEEKGVVGPSLVQMLEATHSLYEPSTAVEEKSESFVPRVPPTSNLTEHGNSTQTGATELLESETENVNNSLITFLGATQILSEANKHEMGNDA